MALRRFWNFSKYIHDTGLDTVKESVVILMTGLLKTFSRTRFLDSLQQDANQPPHRQFPRLQFILDSTDRIICLKHQSYYNLTCPRPYRASLLLPASNPPHFSLAFKALVNYAVPGGTRPALSHISPWHVPSAPDKPVCKSFVLLASIPVSPARHHPWISPQSNHTFYFLCSLIIYILNKDFVPEISSVFMLYPWKHIPALCHFHVLFSEKFYTNTHHSPLLCS